MITISLFYYYEKMFFITNIWIIGKNSMKQRYLKKKDFYGFLNMKDITNADYVHAKRVCKDFQIKHLGECHDLYVQSNTLLLADVFENFRDICINTYKLDPAKFLSAPRLAWQAALKRTKVNLDLLL